MVQLQRAKGYLTERRIVFFIVGLAFLLRLYFFSYYGVFSLSPDGQKYMNLAYSLVALGKYGYNAGIGSVDVSVLSAEVPWGYPLFLAFFIKLFGYSNNTFAFICAIQMLMTTALVLLVYLISRELIQSPLKYLPSLIVAVYPSYIWASSFILTEVPYVFVLSLFVLFSVWMIKRQAKRYYFLSGLALGVLTMIRPSSFAFLCSAFLLAGYLWVVRKDRGQVKKLGLFLAGLALIMTPWVIRNYMAFDEFILLSSGSIDPQLAGIYEDENDYLAQIQYIGEHFAGEDLDAIKAYVNQLMVEQFKSDPAGTLKWYLIGKFQRLWGGHWASDPNLFWYSWAMHLHDFTAILGWLSCGALLLLSLIKRKIDLNHYYLISLLAITSASYQYYLAIDRYNFPFVFVLAVMLSIGANEIIMLVKPNRRKEIVYDQE